MYLLYCALTSFFLALLYESTSLRGLHLPNGLLAFLLFGGISLLISSSKRYRIPLFLLSLLMFILSLFNLLKVHFHLADIGFFDVALLKAAGKWQRYFWISCRISPLPK